MKSVSHRLAVTACSALFLALFFSASVPVAAQNSLGTILGHVADPSGAAVLGAGVTITNRGTSVTARTKSNSAGDFVFVNVIPGNYDLRVEAQGFKIVEVAHLRVEVEATVRQDINLQVG